MRYICLAVVTTYWNTNDLRSDKQVRHASRKLKQLFTAFMHAISFSTSPGTTSSNRYQILHKMILTNPFLNWNFEFSANLSKAFKLDTFSIYWPLLIRARQFSLQSDRVCTYILHRKVGGILPLSRDCFTIFCICSTSISDDITTNAITVAILILGMRS